MKKLSTKLFSILTLSFFAVSLVSCGSDEPDPIIPVVSDVVKDLKNGIMKGSLEEDYTLDAGIAYSLPSSFTVADGATLTVPAGTKITAANGGTNVFLAVLKGGKININGTESSPVVMSSASGAAGEWGGLTICGDATTTAGVDATAEVGDFKYGGTNDADNSGTINYLVIKGTGAQINADSQYNGLSLYAVGSGTSINNIAVINGEDDGVEFFGGTVSASNVYVENCEDDAIDWTEGWNGTLSNAYISNTKSGFSTVFEGDKENKNPKFNNITAVSTVGGTALQFKLQSGGTITGLSLSGYDTDLDMKNGGALSNVVLPSGVKAVALTDPTKPATKDKYFYSLNGANVAPTVDVNSFAWTNADLTPDTAVLQGVVTGKVTLDASVKYKLTSSYIVQDGGELVIPAGTKIEARNGGTGVYIAVLKGGKIDIQGTTSNPVVIASASGNTGDWGGLTICGKATTTAGPDSEAEVGGFIYGGTKDDDNSGSIKYLVLRGTGAQINAESQYNGLSLYAVGSGTIIEGVSVINGADDGIEFFGGTVSVSKLYLENNEDDSVDWTEGWSGTVTDTYISHTKSGFSTAFEGDKKNNNPKFVNVTAISSVNGTALQFKKQSGATITNLYLEGYAKQIDMKDGGPLANVKIDGKAATTTTNYNTGTKVDVSGWSWKSAGL